MSLASWLQLARAAARPCPGNDPQGRHAHRPEVAQPGLERRPHRAQPRLSRLRHAVCPGCQLSGPTTDGPVLAPKPRRPCHHHHPAARAPLARRQPGDGARLRRLAKRRPARDSMGQKLADFLKEYSVTDERTYAIVLKERLGPLLEAIGKPSMVVPFMMPKQVVIPSSKSATTRARGRSSC